MNQSAGEALLNDPINTIVQCKHCGIVLVGAAQALDHNHD